MGKNRDTLNILIIVLIGIFIPFFCSIAMNYGLELFKIGVTFVYFLLFFGIELFLVYLYFTITNWMAQKSMNKVRVKNKKGLHINRQRGK
jgi:uncharacterized membrane protein